MVKWLVLNKKLISVISILCVLSNEAHAVTSSIDTLFSRNKYYNANRHGPSAVQSSNGETTPLSRPLKLEEGPEGRENSATTPVEKRCSRCDPYDRYPGSGAHDPRSRYYEDGLRRPPYRGDYDRYDRDRYYDRDYDRGGDRDYRYNRYDPYDRYDRYEGRYDRYNDRDRYDRGYDRGYGYDRDRYDRGGYDRGYDRGIGYDNRGYDNRNRYDDRYDDYRGGGYDGRGYYEGGRPDYGGAYYGGGYASRWNYGGDRDRYGGSGYGGGYGGGYSSIGGGYSGLGGYRYRSDPAYYDGFTHGTSYLYGRPSVTTTTKPQNDDNNNAQTQSTASLQRNTNENNNDQSG